MKKVHLSLLCLVYLSMNGYPAVGQEIRLLRNLSSLLGSSKYRLMESVEMGGKLYFSTWSERGTELWYTDGTVTAAIYEWPLGYLGYDYALSKMYVFNNRLLFTGLDSAHGKELWTSDGTTAGTQLLKDINPGPAWAFFQSPQGPGYGGNITRYLPFAEMNGRKYFIVTDTGSRVNIWQTDGTAAGTARVQVFNTYPASGMFGHIGAFNNQLYFTAAYDNQDFGTYMSDGTVAGTSELSHGFLFQDYFMYDGLFMFNRSGGRGLAQSDGSGISIIHPTESCGADRVSFNNKLYFFDSKTQRQFYMTDGTASGTALVKDALAMSPDMPVRYRPLDVKNHCLVTFNNSMYFCGPRSIWKSDGSTAGTVVLKGFPHDTVNTGHRITMGLIEAGHSLYFKLWDTSRMELFVSDGTAAGTHIIPFSGADYRNTSYADGVEVGAEFPSEPMIVYKNKLIFTGIYQTAVGKALYSLDLPLNVPSTAGSKQNMLVAFPNPTSGKLHIRYPDNGFTQASICDALGRIVYHRSIHPGGSETLSLEQFSSGTYFLKLTGPKQHLSAPVIIQR